MTGAGSSPGIEIVTSADRPDLDDQARAAFRPGWQHKWDLPPLTGRDAAARAPLDALDLDGAPAFLTPSDLPGPALAWGTW
jgi:hypothetical protein